MLSRQFILLVTVSIAIVWFALLGHRDLIDPDEGRYAEIPREMVASGDWLTPRLNGFKYFEKPVLQYWVTAVGYTLFGESNWSARLWPAFVGFLGALWAGYLGLRLYGETAGFYAFVMTVSGLLYVGIGHMLSLDMALSVFTAIGVGSTGSGDVDQGTDCAGAAGGGGVVLQRVAARLGTVVAPAHPQGIIAVPDDRGPLVYCRQSCQPRVCAILLHP